jgi:hypothetical protein
MMIAIAKFGKAQLFVSNNFGHEGNCTVLFVINIFKKIIELKYILSLKIQGTYFH